MQPMATKQLEHLDRVVIRFAGDSGDGMQLTGTQFTNTAALLGTAAASAAETIEVAVPGPALHG